MQTVLRENHLSISLQIIAWICKEMILIRVIRGWRIQSIFSYYLKVFISLWLKMRGGFWNLFNGKFKSKISFTNQFRNRFITKHIGRSWSVQVTIVEGNAVCGEQFSMKTKLRVSRVINELDKEYSILVLSERITGDLLYLW